MAQSGAEERITEAKAVVEKTVGKASAGQDPRKREKIIEGARRVFFAKGFDATSMDDISAESGVSKATLYVYFENKERLFSEVIGDERRKMALMMFSVDHDNHDVPAVLGKLGREVVRVTTTPYVVMSFRAVLGIGERIPELGAAYYDEGPREVINRLALYLERHGQLGLLDIEDCDLAAAQFLDMAQTTMSRPMLFSAAPAPTEERIDHVVDSAVRVFMAAYGKPSESTAR
jgi:AcrR family transcriptional regulator